MKSSAMTLASSKRGQVMAGPSAEISLSFICPSTDYLYPTLAMSFSPFQFPCIVQGLTQELGNALYGSEDCVRSPSSVTIKSDFFLVQCFLFFYFPCPGNDFLP